MVIAKRWYVIDILVGSNTQVHIGDIFDRFSLCEEICFIFFLVRQTTVVYNQSILEEDNISIQKQQITYTTNKKHPRRELMSRIILSLKRTRQILIIDSFV